MAGKTVWCLGLALALNSVAATAANIEATTLDYVTVDGLSCDRIFFRSTESFKHTIFSLPNVAISGGPDWKRAYEIEGTTDPKKYFLTLRLYFPETTAALASPYASTNKAELNDCNNDDLVRAVINRNISNPRDEVKSVAKMPISSITVSINGFTKTGRIPEERSDRSSKIDFIRYQNQVLETKIEITDNERNYFLSNVVRKGGIPVNVDISFQANGRDGSVTAQLDVDAFSTAFQAAVKAKGPWLVKADVDAGIRAAWDSKFLRITSTAGKSDVTDKVRDQFIQSIMADMSKAIEVAAAKANPGDADAKISVETVLEIISTKLRRSMAFTQMGLTEMVTAHTERKVSETSVADPNVRDIEVKADYVSPSTGSYLNEGETMIIATTGWYTDAISYRPVSSYLTIGQVNEFQLANQFPQLSNSNFELKEKEVNGRLLAVGNWKAYLVKLVAPGEYRWIRYQYEPIRKRIESAAFDGRRETFEKMPIALVFSVLGRPFTISQLFQENRFWYARFDEFEQRLYLTAKQDLGLVTFRELMREDDPSSEVKRNDVAYAPQSQPLDMVAQEYRTYLTGRESLFGSPIVLREDPRPLILQKTYRFSVTRPQMIGSELELLQSQDGNARLSDVPARAAAPLPNTAPEAAPNTGTKSTVPMKSPNRIDNNNPVLEAPPTP